MPIKPENLSLYLGGSPTSPEWKALRCRILERAKDNCERCGVSNGEFILRSEDGKTWYHETPIGDGEGAVYCAETGARITKALPWYDFPAGDNTMVKIVLTIAHLDQDLTNNDDKNLKALCQRCHNRHDSPYRQKNAAKTRHARKAVADLFGDAT